MRRLIVSTMLTLDGVMEAPGGEPTHPHTGWVVPHADGRYLEFKLQETLEAQTLLIGRVSYESFAGAFPGMEGPLADKMNGMEKVVVSATLSAPSWPNTHVVSGNIYAAVQTLKAGEGGPILTVGSRTLAQALLAWGLVDELRLMTFPVTVGGGARLFDDDGAKREWRLQRCDAFESGVVVTVYAPA